MPCADPRPRAHLSLLTPHPTSPLTPHPSPLLTRHPLLTTDPPIRGKSNQTPGPGTYEKSSALPDRNGLSMYADSTKTSPAKYKWGTGPQCPPPYNNRVPGPGSYKLQESCKPQQESNRPSSAAWVFGTSERPDMADSLVG